MSRDPTRYWSCDPQPLPLTAAPLEPNSSTPSFPRIFPAATLNHASQYSDTNLVYTETNTISGPGTSPRVLSTTSWHISLPAAPSQLLSSVALLFFYALNAPRCSPPTNCAVPLFVGALLGPRDRGASLSVHESSCERDGLDAAISCPVAASRKGSLWRYGRILGRVEGT